MPVESDRFALQLGIDYYVEQGRYVFTAAYLARRGWCCGNSCRHCPYDDATRRESPKETKRVR